MENIWILIHFFYFNVEKEQIVMYKEQRRGNKWSGLEWLQGEMWVEAVMEKDGLEMNNG